MGLNLPNTFANNTTADAVPVEQNYSFIEDYVNNEVITRDGNVGMQAQLLLVGDPTATNHAANKNYVDAVMPIGVMLPYGGVAAPGGGHWALCNGASLPQASYPELFGVIGSKFGTAPAGNFLLPNMTGKMMIGVNSADTETSATLRIKEPGHTGGSTTPPVLQHQHKIDHNHGVKVTGTQSVNHTHSVNPASIATSSNGAHDHRLSYVADADTAGAGTGARVVGFVGDGSHALVENEPAHTHTVDLPATNTGNPSASHTHSVDLDNYVGNSGDVATGVTVATKYRPPYMTVSFIIRIK